MRMLVALLLLISAPALAQEAPPEPAPEAPAPAPQPSEADQEAAASYRLGLDLIGKGKYAEGCQVLSRISEKYPDSEYAVKAEEQMALAALAEGGEACGGAPPEHAVEQPERPPHQAVGGLGARGKSYDGNGFVELMVSQGLMGPAIFGVGIPLSFGFGQPWSYITLGLVGLGVGITAPILVNMRWPIGEGQAMLVFSGEYVGGLTAAMIADFADMPDAQGVVGLITGGTILGGAAATTYAVLAKPHAGDVSLFRSGFSWGAVFSATSFFFVDPGPQAFARVIAGADGLAAVAGVLSAFVDVSRVRMNVINLSGYAGALAFGLVAGLIQLAVQDQFLRAMWGSMITVGAAGGMVVGVLVSKKIDQGRELAFVGPSGSAVTFDEGRWAFGVPTPTPRPVSDGSMGWQVNLATGRF